MGETIAQASAPWFDQQAGVLDRRVFSDHAIYQRELTHIFARAWNFVCHTSQVREAGEYCMSYIGADEVICVRDRQGQIQVLINSCPHRGNTVCRAEFGNTRSFFCSYHGWNFDLDGTLLGMPGETDFYEQALDKSAWGLTPVAQVEEYRGFVFATFAADAPPLSEFLGWVGRLGLDMLAAKGELEVVPGIVKNRLPCNWKLAVDNLYDWYHVKVSHGSSMRLNLLTDEGNSPQQQMVMLGEYGHGIGGPYITPEQLQNLAARQRGAPGAPEWFELQAAWRTDPQVQAQLGPIGSRSLGHPNIFPNLWVALTNQICLRIPRGPLETELWWITLLPKDMKPAHRRAAIATANTFFGPSGMLEQDDTENWSHSTRGAIGTVSQRQPTNYAMRLGKDRTIQDGSGQSAIESVVSEHGQRWTYQAWQEWMQAESWAELMANHSQPPQGTV